MKIGPIQMVVGALLFLAGAICMRLKYDSLAHMLFAAGTTLAGIGLHHSVI